MKEQRIRLEKEQIREKMEEHFLRICGWKGPADEENELYREAFFIKEQYEEKIMPVLIFSTPQEERIYYAMCIEPVEKLAEMDVLTQFYLDSWMTAALDAARDWLRNYLMEELKKEGKKTYVSYPAGPGFYGIGMEELPKFLRLSGGEKIGIHIIHGVMHPSKAVAGYFDLTEQEPEQKKDCRHCLAGKNCRFCYLTL